MKKLILVSIALSLLTATSVFAQELQCPSFGPTIACIDHLYVNANVTRVEAAKLCKGGVSLSCIDHLYVNANVTRVQAAKLCKGGASVECIDHLYVNANVTRVEAAKLCSSNE